MLFLALLNAHMLAVRIRRVMIRPKWTIQRGLSREYSVILAVIRTPCHRINRPPNIMAISIEQPATTLVASFPFGPTSNGLPPPPNESGFELAALVR